MSELTNQSQGNISAVVRIISGLIAVFLLLIPLDAQALPAFARQTGQNCVSCHAGGQFPELTPYGRMFKMTGYTIGTRDVPLSVMGVINYAKVSDTSKSDAPLDDFQKNGSPVFSSGSLFVAGKVTDNVGLFSQVTYDNYSNANNGDPSTSHSANGKWQGHTAADNIDLRFADRFADLNRDIIVGFSLNNNPSVTDPWNTAAAWMQYVPAASLTSHQFSDASTPYPNNSTGSNVAGVNVYAYWNKLIYAEMGFYQSANRVFSIMSAGRNDANTTKLKGANNPYWRIALTREWGAHNIMVGATGMVAHIYDDNTNISDPNSVSRVKNLGLDAQYQYLLDPHTVTTQVAFMRQKKEFSANTVAGLSAPVYFDPAGNPLTQLANASDTTNTFRSKLTYVYLAKYGGSLSFFNLTGTTNSANQTSGYNSTGQITSTDQGDGITSSRVTGNLTGNPATRGFTYEAFWTPIQNARVGVMYTAYNKFNGATTNYDGFGRNAKDNNTLFGYVWFAY